MSTAELVTSTLGPTTEPLDERGSAVRFETQCVVIPDSAYHSRRPRVVTKSYALPLWRRRTSPGGSSASLEDVFLEENQSQLVLRVPLPTLSLKPRLRARSVDETPLPPCLVHRHPSGPCSSTPLLARHARTPRKPSLSPSSPDILTVPLRPCCAACHTVTEAALADGDAWQEQFSRAASRRRSLSADAASRTITVAGSAASASYGNLGTSISVDEIDKRRRASKTGPLTTNSATLLPKDTKAKEECRLPLIFRLSTAAPNSSATDTRNLFSPTPTAQTTPRIPEEDDENENENELFPLPSPKRSPAVSPAPSPAGSLSSLTVARANQSRSVSSPTPSSCSGDSDNLYSGKQRFFTPPPGPSSSSLVLPQHSKSTADLILSEDPPRAPSPNILSTLPPLSGRRGSVLPSPRFSPTVSASTDALISVTERNPPRTPDGAIPKRTRIVPPSSTRPWRPSTSHHSPSSTYPRFTWRSKHSVSTDAISPMPASFTSTFSPSTLSTSPNTKKFTMAGTRNIIVDVLRGVGTMGSSGIVPGV